MKTKFILTGFPRTGTTVISASLLVHPQAIFYGEIFNNMAQVRDGEARRITMGAGWKFDKPLAYGVDPCDLMQSSRSYLDQLFSQEVPYKAMGFKIMYDQVAEGPNSDVWDYLAENTDIKIIRTQRADMIAIICSYVRAHLTKRWHTTGENLPNQNKFVVPPHECLNLMQRFEKLPRRMDDIINSHQLLDLDYEKISNNFSGCMTDVSEFLGIAKSDLVEPRLKKIASLAPNVELANYIELKEHFKNTPYGKYFIY